MSQSKFCASCGSALNENEKFCGSCGARVEASVAQPVMAGQPIVNSAQPVQNNINENKVEQSNVVPPQPVENNASSTQSVVPNVNVNQGVQPNANSTQPVMPNANVNQDVQPNMIPPQNNQQNMNQNEQQNMNTQQFANGQQTPYGTNQYQNGADPTANAKPLNIKLIAIASAAILIIVVAIVLIFNITKYQKIDAKDLFRIEVTGINDMGYCVGVINADESLLNSDYVRMYSKFYGDDVKCSDYLSADPKKLQKAFTKAGDKDEAKEMRDAMLSYSELKYRYNISIKLSKTENISNGDKIKCVVSYNEDDLADAKIKLTNTEFEYVVKGLQDGQKIDMFDGLEIKYTGTDGYGEVELTETSTKYPFITYYDDYVRDLSNGDKITVHASLDYNYDIDFLTDETAFVEYNDVIYLINDEENEKEFVVSGLAGLEEIDVFEDIEILYSGASPYLYISEINTDNCSEVVKDNVNFYYESSKAYKIGDTINIQANVYETYMNEDGYKAKGTKDSEGYYVKSIEVTGDNCGSYITDESSKEDLSKIDSLFESETKVFDEKFVNEYFVGSYYTRDAIAEISKMKELETYIILPKKFKDGTLSKWDASSVIYKVYEVKAKTDEGENITFYAAIGLYGVHIDADGEIQKGDDSVKYLGREGKETLISKDIKTTKVNAYALSDLLKKASSSNDKTDSSKVDESSSSKSESSSSTAKSDSSSKKASESSEMVP